MESGKNIIGTNKIDNVRTLCDINTRPSYCQPAQIANKSWVVYNSINSLIAQISYMQQPRRKADQYLRGKTDATMTLKKYQELKAKREKLIKFVRPRQSEEVQKYAQDGDFSENAAYQIAKGKLRGTNRMIDEIEDMLKRADIIEPIENSGFVRIGSIVTVGVNDKEKIYQILGASETDPGSGIISKDSPLGQALLGKRPGETAAMEINGKITTYKIIKIK